MHLTRLYRYGDINANHRTKHGGYKTKEYQVWTNMIIRCYGVLNCSEYGRYGGRGIKVCDRWRKSFSNFLKDMGKRPDGYTLDRIDNDGNYEPKNCRWTTQTEQHRNTRRNVLSPQIAKRILQLRQNGLQLKEIQKRMGFNYWTICDVIYRGAWQ